MVRNTTHHYAHQLPRRIIQSSSRCIFVTRIPPHPTTCTFPLLLTPFHPPPCTIHTITPTRHHSHHRTHTHTHTHTPPSISCPLLPSLRFANGGGDYFAPQFFVENIDGMPNGSFQGNKSVYSTSIIGNVSLAWIRKVVTSNSAPFMAYIAPKAAHDPFEPATWYDTASTTVCTQRVTAWVLNSVPNRVFCLAECARNCCAHICFCKQQRGCEN